MRLRSPCVPLLLAASLVVGLAMVRPALAVSPERVKVQLRDIRSDTTRAWAVRGYRLDTGLATVVLEDGVLVPSTSVGDRPVEYAFQGAGKILLEPPDQVEVGQLELFTGSRELAERFRRAVFVVARDEASDALLRLPPAGEDPRVAAAVDTMAEWHESAERKLLDVEARLFADGVSDPLASSYFCGYIDGTALGRFLYIVDPITDEQVTLGQFVRPEMTRKERRQAQRRLDREQRQGKLIGLEVSDLGGWDTWVSTRLRNAAGEPTAGSFGVEPDHYAIDVALRGRNLVLEATARVTLQVLVEGLRAVTFAMAAELTPVAVRLGDGTELVHQRGYGDLAVLLPNPAAAGSRVTIEISYRGRPFERLGSRTYVQRSTLRWYPRVGRVDRATYDVTVRWPAQFDLHGSGRVVDGGADREGLRWQRRVLDVRALGFSFEVGDYEVVTGTAGHVAVTVAIDRIGQQVSGKLADEVLAAVQDCLVYFEEIFGPYPLHQLEVVSASRGHSQGLLGFVTLSTMAIQDWDLWGEVLGIEDRRTVIAHEVAHQWWGNLVGWASYRDQWISEAMATYSALLYARNRLQVEASSPILNGPTRNWQSALLRPTVEGRPIESLGPVVLGGRLNSSHSTTAYRAIVYKKGAVVLDMLARYFSEEVFLQILRAVVEVASDQVVSTEDLIGLVERLGGTDLEWFRDQYIYGTGLPEIYYSYQIAGRNGRWIVTGEVEQRSSSHIGYEVVGGKDDGFDVRRTTSAVTDTSDWVLVVPFQVGVRLASGNGDELANDPSQRGLRTGRLVLSGDHREFRLELEQPPEIFWLDRGQQVYGRFFCMTREPRLAAYRQAEDLAGAGQFEAAEQLYRESLAAVTSLTPAPWRPPESEVQRNRRLLAASAHLGLARLYLDTDRDRSATDELERARELIELGDRWRFEGSELALETRLAIRGGRMEKAFKDLRKGLLDRRGAESAEGYALLAIAARATDHPQEFEQACRLARERGVDVGPLGCP